MEKGMATHSSILACRIPWTEEPWRATRTQRSVLVADQVGLRQGPGTRARPALRREVRVHVHLMRSQLRSHGPARLGRGGEGGSAEGGASEPSLGPPHQAPQLQPCFSASCLLEAWKSLCTQAPSQAAGK